jgi:hypothetical protein
MEPTSPRKVGVQISVNDDDSEEDKTTPESAVVKTKLDNHNIKQMSNLLKVSIALASAAESSVFWGFFLLFVLFFSFFFFVPFFLALPLCCGFEWRGLCISR